MKTLKIPKLSPPYHTGTEFPPYQPLYVWRHDLYHNLDLQQH